jgi:hypothetical protein
MREPHECTFFTFERAALFADQRIVFDCDRRCSRATEANEVNRTRRSTVTAVRNRVRSKLNKPVEPSDVNQPTKTAAVSEQTAGKG